jgi:hypothetical protein
MSTTGRDQSKHPKTLNYQISNYFSHAEANTVENWLQAFAFAWNQRI